MIWSNSNCHFDIICDICQYALVFALAIIGIYDKHRQHLKKNGKCRSSSI